MPIQDDSYYLDKLPLFKKLNDIYLQKIPNRIIVADKISKRDTIQIVSPTINVTGKQFKRIFYTNSLDQPVTLSIEMQYIDGGWIAIGVGQSIGANAGANMINESNGNHPVLQSISGNIRIKLSFASAPTVGIISCFIDIM